MHYFRGIHSAVHAGIAGLCWWVLQHLDQLQAAIADYRHYAVPLVLAGLALLFRTSDALSNVIVEKIPLCSRALRRLLSGTEFIEGDWPLVVIDMEKQLPLYFGFLRIGFKNGQPYIRGDDWKIDGEHAHAFHSVQSLYQNHTLQYWYKQGQSLHEPDMRGYTEIFFFPEHVRAERHAGKFLDPRHTNDIRFYAKRQRYRPFERRLATSERKIAEARKLWKELEPRLGVLQDRQVSADFI